jgi:hypothetical protein
VSFSVQGGQGGEGGDKVLELVLKLEPVCYLSKMAYTGICSDRVAREFYLAGQPVPYECRAYAASYMQVGPAGASSDQEIGEAIQTGIGLGLQVFSAIFGAIHGIDPATGLVTTDSGQVPVSELGTTTVGETTYEPSPGFFTGTNLLVIGGIGLLAVIMLTGRRR